MLLMMEDKSDDDEGQEHVVADTWHPDGQWNGRLPVICIQQLGYNTTTLTPCRRPTPGKDVLQS